MFFYITLTTNRLHDLCVACLQPACRFTMGWRLQQLQLPRLLQLHHWFLRVWQSRQQSTCRPSSSFEVVESVSPFIAGFEFIFDLLDKYFQIILRRLSNLASREWSSSRNGRPRRDLQRVFKCTFQLSELVYSYSTCRILALPLFIICSTSQWPDQEFFSNADAEQARWHRLGSASLIDKPQRQEVLTTTDEQ